MEELKKLLEEQRKAFEEFKKENDKGKAADQAVIAKLEAKLIETETKARAAQDELEKKLNRIELGAGGAGEPGAAKDREHKRVFFEGFIRKGADKLSPDEQKALPVSNDTTGGYLAPPTFVADIIKAIVLISPFRDLVTVRNIGTSELQQPKRTGTAAATRQGESSTRAETQNPSWGLMKIPAPEMYAEARLTWANLEDSAFDLEALLRDEFSEQFGVKEGAEVVAGNGVNQILGFLDANAAGLSTPIAYTPSTQAATIAGAAAGSAGQADPLIDLYHSLKTAYAKNATWVLNRVSLGKVRKLKDTTGQYLWQPGVGQSGTLNQMMAPTILNAPYVEMPDMPDEGANAFPIAFGDWKRAFTIVERVDMVITRDPFTLANVGQVKIFARRRVGGQVVLGEAIRLYKCAVT